VTLPLLLALKRCTGSERARLVAVLKSAAQRDEFSDGALDLADGEPLDVTPAIELIERYHGVADTVRRAEQHVARAISAIAVFPDGRARADLLAAAEYCVSRDR
jgi:geranylgeranyl pyrophosphate synthase